MQDYISISTLNDFIFCPYSIYLHNVYMGGDEELVHATPQAKGKAAHAAIDGYDISNNKLRAQFSKFLIKQGGVRLQFSVYEINNTKRLIDTLKIKIEGSFAKKFDMCDSIFIFETDLHQSIKYGNAIHRDMDLLYFD